MKTRPAVTLLSLQGWDNFYHGKLETTHGQSPFGVEDMAGNVSEYVLDWYDPSYYANSPEVNPERLTKLAGIQSSSWRKFCQ